METNVLKDPGFETEWTGDGLSRCLVFTPDVPGQVSYWTQRGEIHNPTDWFAWYVHDHRPPSHDPSNSVGWSEPETVVIKREVPFLDPPRIQSGNGAMKMFTFFRIHDGGYMQQIAVVPGQRFKATAHAHAWTDSNDNPYISVGVGGPYAALEGALPAGDPRTQATFWIGVDPMGGQNPFNPRVVWSKGMHIYNVYAQLPGVEVTAAAPIITVFTRQRFLWPLKHCDGYVDTAELILVEDTPSPSPSPSQEPEPVAYDYPVVKTGTKLTTHAIGEGGTYDILIETVAAGHPLPWLKILAANGDKVWAKRAKQLSPATKVVCRVMRGTDPTVNIEGPDFNDLLIGPKRYMDSLKPIIAANPEVDYWELWNESDPVGAAGHVQMARFAIECMKLASMSWEAEGIHAKLAHMAYSTGVPEFEEWQAIFDETDFFQMAQERGDILSLHAYGETPEDVEWHLLRPKRLYDEILIPNNCVVPFGMTEYSLGDYIKNNPRFPTYDSIMEEYGKVDDLYAELYYCLFAAVFTFGEGWQNMYNHNADFPQEWQKIIPLMLSKAERQNAIPPEIEPEPEPEPSTPQYDRLCYLVPQNTTEEQFVQIARIASETKSTVAYSADDAGLYALLIEK